mmetsp:Transcript_134088/g.244601  ORF Transcript_134088/g.244601 Transcript_134088/m.244601 type:complete len:93 (-) Transcript_134088:376-654(-)
MTRHHVWGWRTGAKKKAYEPLPSLGVLLTRICSEVVMEEAALQVRGRQPQRVGPFQDLKMTPEQDYPAVNPREQCYADEVHGSSAVLSMSDA